MARALSQVYTIIRGSVGGITYLSNQYHQIIARARTAPTQPVSEWRTAIKTAFSFANGLWTGIAQSQRDRWQTYAAGTPYSGPLGSYTVPGRIMFIAIFTLCRYLNDKFSGGFDLLGAAPITPGWITMAGVSYSPLAAPGIGFQVSFLNNIGNPAIKCFQERSPAFEPRVNFYKGPWLAANSQLSPSIPSGTSGFREWTGLETGKIYFVKVRFVATTTPERISSEQIIRCIASTTV
jgi:hypothetical protein